MKYHLVKCQKTVNGQKTEFFGVASSDGRAVDDISDNLREVEKLVCEMNENGVSSEHFYDVINDFIAGLYTKETKHL